MTGATTAYDDLPDGVVIADEAGSVVVVNQSAARLLRRTADDALGNDYRDVLPLRDSAGRDWWAATTPYCGLTSRIRQPERRLTLVGRVDCDLLVTARYVRDPVTRATTRLVVALRDTAGRDRHERERADLVSTVAHELRSPLTSVKGFTATLLGKWERFTDEQKKHMLTTVNADADRVTRLLSELLDVARIDAGRLELRRQVVDVVAAVRRLFGGRIAAGEPEDRFALVCMDELPEMWLDPDKLDEILGNLVENAVRHGAGTVTVTVTGVDTGAVVAVADEGEGIPEDCRSQVFTKFWRAKTHGGTGLGLYIARGLVEAHGGTIEVGNGRAGGAEFRFTLPAGTPSFL